MMCTAVTFQTPAGDVLFGRTMDFSYPLDPELYLVPKGLEWINIPGTHALRNRYRFMGIGQDISPIVFADGVNEKGLAVATLYFPDYARYDDVFSQNSPQLSLAATELVRFLLGMCASVEQAASALRSVRIVGVKDAVTNTVAPLHWIMADKSGACKVIEKMADGLHILDNPIGVLSNSPNFPWHMTNLRGYVHLTAAQPEQAQWGGVSLTPFGQGGGTFGMPGDYTPPSRFVRTAYMKSHTAIPADRNAAAVTGFHMLESVSIPKGAVITSRDTPDYTQYTAFIDLAAGEYFFTTYDNPQIAACPWPSGADSMSQITSLGRLNRPVKFEGWPHGSASPL